MAADLQIACSVGPPTGSDTSIPTDQFSVGGDYVLILALPTEIGFTNRKEKPLRSGSLTTACLRFQRALVFFRGRGRCFSSTSVWPWLCCQRARQADAFVGSPRARHDEKLTGLATF
jgi:hypothetical protein